MFKLILENEEEALFSKELATIRRDAPIKTSLKDLFYKGIPIDDVSKIFRTFYFPSLIARLPKQASLPMEEVAVNMFDEHGLDAVGKGATVFLFLEGEKVFVATEHKTLEVPEHMLGALYKDLLEKGWRVVVDDAKTLFYKLKGVFPINFDIKIASWVLNPERRIFSLKDLAEEECDGKFHGLGDAMLALDKRFRERIEKDELEMIYQQFEIPLTPVLFEMEQRGIRVDVRELGELEREIARELERLERNICDLAGESFDVNSPKQLGKILFEKLSLSTKGIKKTSTKSVSTQASELLKLQGAHPIIEPLLKYRELSKLFSTYISVLPKLVDANERIHTTFQQTGAATGRLSSTDPNLQNIPIRTELGRRVRKAFLADSGHELVSFDYSQLELRIAAALSEDKKLMGAFRDKQDVHTRTAMEIFHVKKDGVTSEMRRRAKTINFGILYGMGARALAQGMKVSFEEAQGYLAEYLKEFPGIEEYREQITAYGRKKGYVQTIFGRRRYLPNLKSKFEYVRAEAERMAMNAPIQGTEADLIKRAMVRIERELKLSARDDVRMLLQVHDELLFEIKKSEIEKVVPLIVAIMEDVPELSVPIVVDARRGANWQEMKVI